MKCIIPDGNAKIFAKTVQFLARIGDNLFIETFESGLTLRTNYTKAYDCDNDESNRCRLSMKSVLGIFKNMKNVKQCSLCLDLDSSQIIVCLKCKLDTMRTHSLNILEHKSLKAVYLRENFPNFLHSSHITFADIVSSFRLCEEEITFNVKTNEMMANNYIEGSKLIGDMQFMKSQLSMKSTEFDRYNITEETSITFCLRELRAFLNIAEALGTSIDMNFETKGKPVVFVVKSDDVFEINLVMSTVKDDEDIDIESVPVVVPPQTTRAKQNTSKKSNTGPNINNVDDNRKRRRVNELDDGQDELFNFIPIIDCTSSTDATDSRNILTNMNDIPRLRSPSQPVSTITSNLNSEEVNTLLQDKEDIIFDSELVPIDDDEEINNVNQIEKSPTSTSESRSRTRFLFRRCFEPTFDEKNLPGADQILAEDSD